MNRRFKQAFRVARDRRIRWCDRREHHGPLRILFIPVGELARRAAAAVLGIF
jgi:hypothetical protein